MKESNPPKNLCPAGRSVGPASAPNDQVALVRMKDLWMTARWMKACAWSKGFFLAGFRKRELVLNRIRLDTNEMSLAVWPIPTAVSDSVELVTEHLDDSFVNVFSGQRFLQLQKFGGERFTGARQFEENVLGIAAVTFNWTIEVSGDDLALYGRDATSHGVVSTHSISRLPPGADRAQLIRELGFVPMIAQKEQVIFAIGSHVGRLHRNQIDWIELEQPVLSLHTSQPHAKLRLVATHVVGASVLWADSDW